MGYQNHWEYPHSSNLEPANLEVLLKLEHLNLWFPGNRKWRFLWIPLAVWFPQIWREDYAGPSGSFAAAEEIAVVLIAKPHLPPAVSA